MRIFDPLDTAARDELMSQHPIMLKTYFTLTPTIVDVYERVRDLIYLSEPSMYFWSTPRMGKTECAKAIRYLISQEFPDKMIILASCDPEKEKGIVPTIFKSLGLEKDKYRISLAEIRDRVIDHIVCELSGKHGKHCLLMIDEMQAMVDKDYQGLQAIQNELKLNNISLTTVGFAQHQINSMRTSLVSAGKIALVARFLSRRGRFHGCKKIDWLASTLQQFDDGLQFPEMSTCTYTQFFLPTAYAAGFRLQSCSELIYKEAKKAVSNSKAKIIPTAHLFTAIGYMLATGRSEDKPEFVLTPTMVSRAIKISGMAEFAGLVDVTGDDQVDS
ncbi:hypothetical protein JOE33_000072 [Pseudomonas sp. PvP027]|jgi:hypothetical protein|uniref:ATP-binding protein n=1 Tax=Pseudomonas sp. PvP027 TaxID=2806587 RepID=UPI0001E298D8|nr:ATP-binding protein [Pseudomonas sp. PvP027]MBP1143149.1 hypothetical protein [Pseudomonas sp. PvP027]